MKKIILFACLVAVLVVIDIISKVILFTFLAEGTPYHIIPGILDIVTTWNTGVAFSLFADGGIWLVLVSFMFVVASFLLWLFWGRKHWFLNLSFAFFVGGALGNLYDRLIYGAVRDFISPAFIDFAVFNFADIFLNIGTFMLCGFIIITSIKGAKK